MSKISIVIPVYYNSDTLRDLYEDLKNKVLGTIGEYEIVFVDDGSGDESWKIMNEIRLEDSNVKCVKLSRNFGEHAAIFAGLSVCTGDCAVTKQADLQEDSSLILQMYESWKKGNEIVLAARRTRKDNPIYVLFAGMYYKLIRKMVNKNMPMGGCDCYLVGRKAINELIKLNEKNSSLTLQVMWLGFQTDIIYFDRLEREKGKGRWTMAKKVKLVMDSILSFSYAPLRMMMYAGFIFDIFSLIMFIVVLVEYFSVGTPIAGWSSLMSVVLLGFGMMMTMIGIIGEYIWRALDASRNRPPFIIDTIKTGDEDIKD
ncbi:MAG: glycosyltransferase family 2 protein [Lachnospiraceae bacterium]|nr:glycosyltransferase family 2 protein [Lachnospiraceae bacterium]MCR5440975.1 glycosyltransferase family 2 protein [Lachnospiraceae bacterium]